MPPTHLVLRTVSKSYGGRLVLDRAGATVRPGERVGIVGENGSGKSALLRLAAGTEPPDDGEVSVRADGGVGHLPQEVAFDRPDRACHVDGLGSGSLARVPVPA